MVREVALLSTIKKVCIASILFFAAARSIKKRVVCRYHVPFSGQSPVPSGLFNAAAAGRRRARAPRSDPPPGLIYIYYKRKKKERYTLVHRA